MSAARPDAAVKFTGFPPEALEFYDGLEEDNSRTYWLANKATFEQAVREPMAALLAGLPDAYGSFHMFRPNRDVRFSADKSPYKTAQGAVSGHDAGGTYYLQISSAGLLVASGMYMMAPDQLARFRAAVADDSSGEELEQVIKDLRRAKIAVEPGHDEPLKTAPRGYPKDHPRIERLRWKAMHGEHGDRELRRCSARSVSVVASRGSGTAPRRSRLGSSGTSARPRSRGIAADREAEPERRCSTGRAYSRPRALVRPRPGVRR